MKKKRYVLHVVPAPDGGWKVLHGENVLINTNRKSGITKVDVVNLAVGRALVKEPSQVVIHKRDGTIQSERTYGNDPKRTKG